MNSFYGILSVVLLAVSFTCDAQQDAALYEFAVADPKIPDSIRVKKLLDAAEERITTQPATALVFCRKASEICNKNLDKTRMARAYQLMGRVYEKEGNLDSALKCYNKAHFIKEKTGQFIEESQVLHQKAELSLIGQIRQPKSGIHGLKNMLIYLKAEDGEILTSTITDDAGNFKFNFDYAPIAEMKNYLLVLDESNPTFNPATSYMVLGRFISSLTTKETNDVKLQLSTGDSSQTVSRLTNLRNHFSFDYLPQKRYGLSLVQVKDDLWSNYNIARLENDSISVITESIVFENGTLELSSEIKLLLNKVGNVLVKYPNAQIEIANHTDSRGDAGINLETSRRRARAMVDFILETKKVSSLRLLPLGLGESMLLNLCVDGVFCEENQHKENERTEFKIIWNQ